jgi:hypothetical protein
MGGFDLDMNARAGAAVIEMAAGDTPVGLPLFARILCKPLRAILFGILDRPPLLQSPGSSLDNGRGKGSCFQLSAPRCIWPSREVSPGYPGAIRTLQEQGTDLPRRLYTQPDPRLCP